MKKLTKQQEDAIKRAVRLANREVTDADWVATQMEIDAYNDIYCD